MISVYYSYLINFIFTSISWSYYYTIICWEMLSWYDR